MALTHDNDLIQLQIDQPPADTNKTAANGAPAGEPETWNSTVPAFNPLFDHTPEPEPLAVSPDLVAELADPAFEIEAFLAAERSKDLLRFSTAGSVDDGKSTLIGRLLYDTRSVYEDQVRSIEGKGSAGAGVLDLALLTDGLRAEREQGITIDVAYRYVSTARRKFIIADTPGHEQYTRNMATGASTADVAIVLVDARKGVLSQSRRHAWITALLGVRHVLIAVNKMDLVGFDQAVFDRIVSDFTAFFGSIDFGDEVGTGNTELRFVPVSALAGDNVARVSDNLPWYNGPTLLELLETIPVSVAELAQPFRLAVQRVVRPDQHFRGFAGQIASGTIRVGDPVLVLPSGRTSRVASLVTFDGNLSEAAAPLSITLTLEEETDISRGDLLSSVGEPATVTNQFTASLVWMDQQSLDPSRRYLLKHTARTIQARVSRVEHALGIDLATQATDTLALNGIALVEIETVLPLAVDTYASNRTTGSFILIDSETNATAAAGMIRSFSALPRTPQASDGPVTAAERAHRWGHPGAILNLRAPATLINAVERALFDRGVFLLRADPSIAPTLAAQGAVALTAEPADSQDFHATIADLSTAGTLTETSLSDAAASVLALLRQFEQAASEQTKGSAL